MVGMDHLGNIYLNTLAFDPSGVLEPGAVMISRSNDGGLTFGDPVIAAQGTTGEFLDKNWVAVDASPDSPHPGRIVTTYTNFITGGTPLMSVFSDDNGETWSDPAFYNAPQQQRPRFPAVVFARWNFGCGLF